MISVRGYGRLRRERSSITLSITFSDSSLPPKSGISEQPNRPPRPKFFADTNVPKYSKDNLQWIFKAVLEAWAPALASASAPVVFEVLWEKLKARFPSVYREKSYIDCYNFCQQCEDYFAIKEITESIQISYAASFFRDWISFRLQQYKRRHNTNTPVPVTWDKFKAFFRRNLGDFQVFMDTY